MTDYSQMTDKKFDSILRELVENMSAAQILSYGDVNAFLREELNNEVLSVWEERSHEIKLRHIVTPEALRELFIGRDDEFWGIEHDDEKSWFREFPQFSGVSCTGFATAIKRKVGKRIEVYGFSGDDNPTAGILDLHDGHDFAVLDSRFIIDPWLVEVEKGLITTPTGNKLNLGGKGIFWIQRENWLVNQIYGLPGSWRLMDV